MNRKQYIKFALIYYPLSFVAVFAWIFLVALGNKPGMGILTGIGLSIVAISVLIRYKYGKKRLEYLGKSKWWLVFSLFSLTEPFFHIAMCFIKDEQAEVSALEDKTQ